ncbi:MAG: methyltransferase domain-containing protein [Saprospiraceae bacterium]
MSDKKYIHGYSETEQARLVSQGQVLSPFIFDKLDLTSVKHLLEVGSGVGAMTLGILERYPNLPITCLEISEAQLAKAKINLPKSKIGTQIQLRQADARQTNFEENSTFDGAFLCWVLEHIPQPELVLSELFRVLKKGSQVFITEVFHSSLHLFPNCPNAMEYWQKCIDFQATIDGDANVGHRLGNMLQDAGFSEIDVRPYPMFFDKRQPENRAKMLTYWHGLMFSALENMLEANFCTLELWQKAETEILALIENDDAVFYYSFVQGIARK